MQVKLLSDPHYESPPRAPTRATPGAAAYDLYTPNEIQLPPGVVRVVALGIAVAVPAGHVGLIKDRSSMAKRGIHVLGFALMDAGNVVLGGVIDEDYRGELGVVLCRLAGQSSGLAVAIDFMGPPPEVLGRGDRIAQMVVVPCYQKDVEVVDALNATVRGAGGFGSTGK